MILLIDNYDSFVFNLRRYFIRLGQSVTVLRNDAPELHRAIADPVLAWRGMSKPRAMVLSPGPKRPCDAGLCIELVQRFSGEIPILGICLGHQVIWEALGGQVVRASQPMHGRGCRLQLSSSRLFAELGEQVEMARYHSLVADPASLPEKLRITAWSEDGQVMAAEHRQHATYGVQFHPESILSTAGYRLLDNFLQLAGLPGAKVLPDGDLLNVECLAPLKDPVKFQPASAGEHAVALPNSLT